MPSVMTGDSSMANFSDIRALTPIQSLLSKCLFDHYASNFMTISLNTFSR